MSRAPVHTPDVVRDKLRELLAASKLTQDAFSFVLGCSQAELNGYIHDKSIPLVRQTQIRRLASVEGKNDQIFVVMNFTPSERWKTEVKSRAYKVEYAKSVVLAHEGPSSVPDVSHASEACVVAHDRIPVDRLNTELGQWSRSWRIREYAAAIRRTYPNAADTSAIGRWILWLDRYADNIDPVGALIDQPPPLVIPPSHEIDADEANDLEPVASLHDFDRVVAEELERLP